MSGIRVLLCSTWRAVEHRRKRLPRRTLFADAGYSHTKLMNRAAFLDLAVEIVRQVDTAKGSEVIPRCWVVERTLDQMIRWRRLVRDYEKRLDMSETMIHVAMCALLLLRVPHR